MDLISENIANAETTRTEHGGPYCRKMAVYQCADTNGSFRSMLDSQTAKSSGNMPLNGVKVSSIEEDKAPFPVEYDPSNPDADARGYVQKPNVDLIKETTDMMAVTRAYNANMTAFDSVKDMAAKAIEIGK
jgi:flagellar basal-body rod protein FlgC